MAPTSVLGFAMRSFSVSIRRKKIRGRKRADADTDDEAPDSAGDLEPNGKGRNAEDESSDRLNDVSGDDGRNHRLVRLRAVTHYLHEPVERDVQGAETEQVGKFVRVLLRVGKELAELIRQKENGDEDKAASDARSHETDARGPLDSSQGPCLLSRGR